MRFVQTFIGMSLLICAPSAHAFAATQPNKTEREEMAKVHEEVAACLRSDKGMQECHKIMKDKYGAHKMWHDNMNGPYGGHGGNMMNNDSPQTPPAATKP